tara:strand:- start:1706 stop:2110 length:405 start_codon:yes stop_codon:yes gene_type:complete
MALPDFFKNPFVSTTELYKAYDIFERINLNMLYVVPFYRIFLRTAPHVKKLRIAEADYRYAGILYRSNLDPENTTVKKEFCVFDGTHRIHKMISEGKSSSVFYIIEPHIFDGLKAYVNMSSSTKRTTGCLGCME